MEFQKAIEAYVLLKSRGVSPLAAYGLSGREVGNRDFALFGMESNGSTWALARMNMFLHGADRAREKGDAREKDIDAFFIDASSDFVPGKNQNTLSSEHIDKILNAYRERNEIEKYAHVATPEEVEENDFNLNIPRYVDTFEEEEPIDIDAVQVEIDQLEIELVGVRAKMAEMLEGIKR